MDPLLPPSKKCSSTNLPLPPPPPPLPPGSISPATVQVVGLDPPPPLPNSRSPFTMSCGPVPWPSPGPLPPPPEYGTFLPPMFNSRKKNSRVMVVSPPGPRRLAPRRPPSLYSLATSEATSVADPIPTDRNIRGKLLKAFLFAASAACVLAVTPLPVRLPALHVGIPFASVILKAALIVVFAASTAALYHVLIRDMANKYKSLADEDEWDEKASDCGTTDEEVKFEKKKAALFILAGAISGVCLTALVLGMGLKMGFEPVLLTGMGWGILVGLGCFWVRGVWWKESRKDWDDDVSEYSDLTEV